MTSKQKNIQILLLTCAAMLFPHIVSAQSPYEKKTAKLMTTWGEALDAADPVLPEYPRPQMVREKWLNLNGIWQFQPATSAAQALPAGNLSREILVPFPVESALSGIMEHHENVWYRRTFTVPGDWTGQRVLLHFGAVDYSCEVFVNGQSVGTHQGGYDSFSFDITAKLTGSGEQDLALRVSDPTDAKGYPRGKQTLYPGGIMYTSTTGIWQTVWLEPVPQTYISGFRMVPDIDAATLKFYPSVRGKYRFKIYNNGTEIADWEKEINNSATGVDLDIPQPLKLWSPGDPFLYDMKVYRISETEAVDSVSTYFGMRKISRQVIDGYPRMMLNNEFVFQMGPLDQGFWPDGIYTAPTDEALRFDIETTKALGFNMIRKHIKVEPQRWYYWADKLGMLIWQDMPSMNSYINTGLRPVPPQERTAYLSELEAMIKTHWNSPSIVSWVTFNEYQGSHDEANIVNYVKSWDDSRLVNVNSGCDARYDNINTDIRDYHNYPAPVVPPKNTANTQALVCGEYGGIGYYEQNHIWDEGNPYETVDSYAKLLEKYAQYADMLIYFKGNKGLSAAVYTEITDVEMELNGLMTYDRKVIKGNVADFHAINQRIINENRYYNDIVPASDVQPQSWKYTTAQPSANWYTKDFNDAAWTTGNGGFGTVNTPGAVIGTTWSSNNIWLRRTFTLPADALQQGTLVLKVHHDEDCQIYINGVKALELAGYTSNYAFYTMTQESKAALVPGGENTLAVHCRQTTGGQYIDVGISAMTATEQPIGDYSFTVMGSSVPWGQGAEPRTVNGYAWLWTDYLWNNAANTWTTNNISIGGNTTTDVLNRWDSDLLPSYSRYVYYGLSLGNEGIHERGEAAFVSWRDNMQLLINRARDHDKIPLVGNNYPRGDFNSTDYNYVKQLNLLIHEWDVPSVNLLGAIDNGSGQWANGYVADNAHPNTAGHAEMFYAIVPSLLDAVAAGKPQPVRTDNTFLTLEKTNKTKRIALTPEGTLHSFTLSFSFKTTGTGAIASFVTTAGDTARLVLNGDGKLTYKTQTSVDALNDNNWHTATLTHYYALGRTDLYIDGARIPRSPLISEKLVPLQFYLNDFDQAPQSAGYRELFLYRAGMCAEEIQALYDGKMLKSSLEIYAPLNEITGQDALDNMAQSLNAPSLEEQDDNTGLHKIDFDKNREIKEITIYSLAGQQLFRTTNPLSGYNRKLPAGVYIAKILTTQGVEASKRIVVEGL
jgi:beta-galactosidase/beta-glucuronidase/lysophospholipase L1-like esterase